MVVSPNESDFVSVFGTTDADYYSFNVSSAVKLTAVAVAKTMGEPSVDKAISFEGYVEYSGEGRWTCMA